MPSFTMIALETLLEPTRLVASSTTADPRQNQQKKTAAEPKSGDGTTKKPLPPNHIYIKSPALYTTPEPKPIPPGASAQSVSPSPYVFNRKRRDFPHCIREEEAAAAVNRVDGFEIQGQLANDESSSPGNCGAGEDLRSDTCSDEKRDGVLTVKLQEKEKEEDGDGDFADVCCEARSVASSIEVDDFAKQSSVMSPKCVVFFDADEEFISDGSMSNMSSSHISNLEIELSTTRLSLLEEIEKRKTAEDVVNRMYSQWERIGRKLYESGLTFPTPSPACNSLKLEIDPTEQLLQELVVTRFVSEAIGRAQARAEAEIAAAAIIESKDQEISRLRDRLQYYETVNQEMSQRNLEVVETARRQREKWSQRKWLWGCIGLSVAVGASVIAYSFPLASKNQLATSSDSNASATSKSA